MTADTLFDQNTEKTPSNVNTDLDRPISELVGEGKRYKTVEDLAKAKLEADSFIARLEDEMEELREDLKKRPTAEDIAAHIEAARKTGSIKSGVTEREPTPAQPSLKPEDVESLVEKAVNKREETSKVKANLQEAHNALVEQYGSTEKAKEALVAKAAELGFAPEKLTDLAASSPKALKDLMGIGGTKKDASSPTKKPGSVNVEALIKNADSSVRDYNYYQKIRRENPTVYHSKEIQKQLYKDARAMGDKFFPQETN